MHFCHILCLQKASSSLQKLAEDSNPTKLFIVHVASPTSKPGYSTESRAPCGSLRRSITEVVSVHSDVALGIGVWPLQFVDMM